jgi:hypothetical protein
MVVVGSEENKRRRRGKEKKRKKTHTYDMSLTNVGHAQKKTPNPL